MEGMEIVNEIQFVLQLLETVDAVKCKDILKQVIKQAETVDAVTVILYEIIK